jgi:hypothetical protein
MGASSHKKFTKNAGHFGVCGLISSALVFFVPLALFLKAYRRRINPKLALIEIIYMICELESSMTTEVWNLKLTVALPAIIISVPYGLTLNEIQKIEVPTNSL